MEQARIGLKALLLGFCWGFRCVFRDPEMLGSAIDEADPAQSACFYLTTRMAPLMVQWRAASTRPVRRRSANWSSV